jgi:integrase/recombinase XerD
MADAITALVAEKRIVGYKYVAEERALSRFAAFCCARFPGLEVPTQAAVEAWVAAGRERGVKPATLQALVAPLRELARWLGRRGVPAYVLPAGVLERPTRYVPHIYTDEELASLFAQTDRCHYLLGGPVPPPRHAGAVPHDLCLRPACLRSPPAALRRCRH